MFGGGNEDLQKFKDQMRKFIILDCRLHRAFVHGGPNLKHRSFTEMAVAQLISDLDAKLDWSSVSMDIRRSCKSAISEENQSNRIVRNRQQKPQTEASKTTLLGKTPKSHHWLPQIATDHHSPYPQPRWLLPSTHSASSSCSPTKLQIRSKTSPKLTPWSFHKRKRHFWRRNK